MNPDKRAGLRQHFQAEDIAKKTAKQQQFNSVMQQREARLHHKQQLDRMTSLEKSMISSLRQLVSFLDGKTTKTEVVNQLKSVSTPDIDKVVDALNKLDDNATRNKLDLSPLTEGLKALEDKLDKLPTEYPEMPEGVEEVTVKNQIDLKPLEKAILALKLDPTIEYKAGDVKVDAPDLKPLQDSMLDVIKAFKAQKYPETDLSNVEKKLDTSNKLLKEITEKKFGGGGGGGGNGTPYIDSTGRNVNVTLKTNGAIPVSNSFGISDYDYFAYTSGSNTDTYTFKTGGSGGTTVSTVVLTYTDSTKATLASGVRT